MDLPERSQHEGASRIWQNEPNLRSKPDLAERSQPIRGWVRQNEPNRELRIWQNEASRTLGR
jgi:hypothetical protein